jgi:hypothetical protein
LKIAAARQSEDREEDVTKKEDISDLYRDATDSTRSLIRVRHEAPKRDRVKPDPESGRLAEFDYEELATVGDEAARLWTEQAPQNSARCSNK